MTDLTFAIGPAILAVLWGVCAWVTKRRQVRPRRDYGHERGTL